MSSGQTSPRTSFTGATSPQYGKSPQNVLPKEAGSVGLAMALATFTHDQNVDVMLVRGTTNDDKYRRYIIHITPMPFSYVIFYVALIFQGDNYRLHHSRMIADLKQYFQIKSLPRPKSCSDSNRSRVSSSKNNRSITRRNWNRPFLTNVFSSESEEMIQTITCAESCVVHKISSSTPDKLSKNCPKLILLLIGTMQFSKLH